MTDYELMKRAVELAETAAQNGEIPVGAVVSKNGEIIGEGFNKREGLSLSTAHAEVIAIEQACKALGDWRLSDCTIHVTLEPCPMCAGAIVMSRIKRVVFGSYSPQGAMISKCSLPKTFSPDTQIIGGFLKAETDKIIEKAIEKLHN